MGYALIKLENSKISLVAAGLIKMKAEDLQFQIPQMVEAFENIFSSYKIDEVAMEDIFYAHNPATTIKLAQFRGAIMLTILQHFGQFNEYTALQVKKAVTGKGKATKDQMLEALPETIKSKLIKDLKKSDDVIDAYFLAKMAYKGV